MLVGALKVAGEVLVPVGAFDLRNASAETILIIDLLAGVASRGAPGDDEDGMHFVGQGDGHSSFKDKGKGKGKSSSDDKSFLAWWARQADCHGGVASSLSGDSSSGLCSDGCSGSADVYVAEVEVQVRDFSAEPCISVRDVAAEAAASVVSLPGGQC